MRACPGLLLTRIFEGAPVRMPLSLGIACTGARSSLHAAQAALPDHELWGGCARLLRLGALLLAGALLFKDAQAAVINVSTVFDEFNTSPSTCSLREAVQAANTDAAFGGCSAGSGADVIFLPVSQGVYRLQINGGDEDNNLTGDLDIRSVITVAGQALTNGDIDPEMVELECRTDRCFHVFSGGDLRVVNMTLSGGDVTGFTSNFGGLIRRQFDGILQLERLILRDGRAAQGGAIYEFGNGTTTMTNVTLVGNSATGFGGGWTHRGPSRATLNNVTISGNIANSGGGVAMDGPALFRHVTVTDNVARTVTQGAGGVMIINAAQGSTDLDLENSVLAGNRYANNSLRDDNDLSCTGTQLGGRNRSLIQRGDCTFASVAGPALNADPRLAPLFDYGSAVPTHALLEGSPLIDAGFSGTCLATDARSVARVASTCDIGAYERVINYTVNSTADFPDANLGNGTCAASNGQCTLRAAIGEAAANVGPRMIRVPDGLYTLAGVDNQGSMFTVGSGQRRSITIVGNVNAPAAVEFRISGVGSAFSLLGPIGSTNVTNSIPALALMGVSITGANNFFPGDDVGGAIRVRAGNLLVYRSVLRNNEVTRGDGGAIGIFKDSGVAGRRSTVIVDASALLDNRAIRQSGTGGSGGAIGQVISSSQSRRTELIVRNSTLAGNRADFLGGAIYGSGRVLFSTIVDNQAGQGGGIYFDQGIEGRLLLGNSIVTRNLATPGFGPDCYTPNNAFPISSLGYNLIGSLTGCSLSGDSATNLVGADPGLGPLRADQGPTPAFFPQPTSSVYRAIPASRCGDFGDGSVLPQDQNGDPRTSLVGSSTACNIGAVERAFSTEVQIFLDGFE
ncbi:MAG: CSLREA domain-containing protein [Xanthomonadales bacterium]|nr:CSLREA domain-containing protein [Xanthomonadales bacterium]